MMWCEMDLAGLWYSPMELFYKCVEKPSESMKEGTIWPAQWLSGILRKSYCHWLCQVQSKKLQQIFILPFAGCCRLSVSTVGNIFTFFASKLFCFPVKHEHDFIIWTFPTSSKVKLSNISSSFQWSLDLLASKGINSS